MDNKKYPSDLTDRECNCIKNLIPKAKPGGRPRSLNMRHVLNVIFYLVRGGISWSMLPMDFPNYKSVYDYFSKWRKSGVWKLIHDRLRSLLRIKSGRNSQPSAAIIDSQSVKTIDVGGAEIGFDGGKLIKGRKRQILVDTLGLLLFVVVHSAAVSDKEGAKRVLEKLKHRFSRLKLIWADSAYRGIEDWLSNLRERGKIWLEIVRPLKDQKGFVVQPHRWIVERTFG